MYNTHPIINLAGTEFYIDIHNKEFRELNNETNTIPFDEMVIDDVSVLLFYDTMTRNTFEGMSIGHGDTLQVIDIPVSFLRTMLTSCNKGRKVI
jgi:hypothetical protein